jgi:prepilin-type N-terminal cleavage/methylation domain-containing protein
MKKLRQRRAGFTLVEALVALALLGVLLSITLAALNGQVRIFSSLSAQTDALQNGRFAMGVLEKDLPTAGTNVPAEQPFLVYADTHVVVFNGDYLSNMENDPFAVYVEPGAKDILTAAATKARRFRIPRARTIVNYPDTTYTIAGQNSPAESIQFFVELDTSTARPDDYVLNRRVNDQRAEMVARGLLPEPGVPWFQYFRRVTPVGAPAYLELVPTAQLPLHHVRPIHSAVDDTGTIARIDSLRAVRVSFRVTDEQPGPRERIYRFTRTIPLLNIGLAKKQTCGDEPILGSVNFTGEASVVDNSPIVRLAWLAATDDIGGARDVVRYVIYRALEPGVLDEPYLSIPAGEASYSLVDSDIVKGQVYYYYLAAQDCASALSGTASLVVIVP